MFKEFKFIGVLIFLLDCHAASVFAALRRDLLAMTRESKCPVLKKIPRAGDFYNSTRPLVAIKSAPISSVPPDSARISSPAAISA